MRAVWVPIVSKPMDDCAMEAPVGFYFPDSPMNWEATRARELLRLELFKAQGGRCFWCQEPMSLERTYVSDRGNLKHNQRFASFEHLKRKRDGGKVTRANARLAHEGCNRKRDTHHRHPRYAHDPYPLKRAQRAIREYLDGNGPPYLLTPAQQLAEAQRAYANVVPASGVEPESSRPQRDALSR